MSDVVCKIEQDIELLNNDMFYVFALSMFPSVSQVLLELPAVSGDSCRRTPFEWSRR
jgi:hypothetical protein